MPTIAATATFADRAATERAYLGWLGRTLVEARAARMAGGGRAVQLGTPDGVRFTFDGAIATALGPRDDAWLERAVADTRVAIDVTPWWADAIDAPVAAQPGARASCGSTSAGGRRPSSRRAWSSTRSIACSSRAYPLDPTLGYPWRAWAESSGCATSTIRWPARSSPGRCASPAPDPTIGYRRGAGHDQPRGLGADDPGLVRRDAGRPRSGGVAVPAGAITLAAVQTGTATGAMAAHAFIDQFAGELGPDAIDHRAGGVVGRATLSSDASSGVEIGDPRGLLGGRRLRRRDPDRVRRSGRLAVGHRHLAVARAGLTRAPCSAARRVRRQGAAPGCGAPSVRRARRSPHRTRRRACSTPCDSWCCWRQQDRRQTGPQGSRSRAAEPRYARLCACETPVRGRIRPARDTCDRPAPRFAAGSIIGRRSAVRGRRRRGGEAAWSARPGGRGVAAAAGR